MIQKFIFLFFFVFMANLLFAQQTIDSIQKIEEVIIQTKRLEVPFSETSHTVTVVTSKDIEAMGVSSVDEVLQQLVGVDVRRRGVDGMQADLYIRGGNFNQTLLLIDGIKMDDLQSGHHTMNGILSVENIDRIEIVKGAASRIYGQNAMNGAVNIITKKVFQNRTNLAFSYGSFDNYGINIGTQRIFERGTFQLNVGRQQSDGYRYNTDFTNWNAFLKTTWKDYKLLVSYAQRAFGANGFYASPDYKDQYEETETYLFAIKRQFANIHQNYNTTIYWRRNQDMYVFLRNNPDFYRNSHINNKIGASVDATFYNNLGQTGIGLDVNQGFLVSNNLGDHQRLTVNLFLEHRFQFFDDKLDITPGIALSHYSDFKFFAYPGIDIGYRFSKSIKSYLNIGYTSRIPTYTNLYYESPVEKGNSELKPEKALTYDLGINFTKNIYQINLTYFNRYATDLIDWTKELESDVWEADNFNSVTTQGVEFQMDVQFKIKSLSQKIHLGLLKIDEVIEEQNVLLSRYSLNSYKHRLLLQSQSKFFKSLQQYISYAYTERLDGSKYHLVDFSLHYDYKKWKISLQANNILDADYTETNLVPMPKSNFMTSLSVRF